MISHYYQLGPGWHSACPFFVVSRLVLGHSVSFLAPQGQELGHFSLLASWLGYVR